MKIAVIGGGFTGLSTAYYLAKKGHQVTIFEKEKELGGLASCFKNEKWDWFLEKSYHHYFSNDYEFLRFAKEIGFNEIFFQSPTTASIYKENHNYRIFPLDNPQDLLFFPLLGFFDRIRAGFFILFLKLSPFLPIYEKKTSANFLKRTMGEKAWVVLWEELFRKKFGKSAENVLASFIWARVKKRTKKLGYVKGGIKKLADHIIKKTELLGVIIKKQKDINNIKKTQKGFMIEGNDFDVIVSTIASPLLAEKGKGLFPAEYINRLKKIKYSASLTAIIETDALPFKKIYWLNNLIKKIPFMVFVQHTNFINKKNYNNHEIIYFGNYLEQKNKFLKKTDEEIVKYYLKNLKKITGKKTKILNSYIFKQFFAQPIFDESFIKNKPDFKTPLKNFYIANLEMTYPYDRGVNYAMAVGKKVSKIIDSTF